MNNDVTLHIRLEKTLKQELEKYAEAYSLKLSNVVRIALEEFAYKDHEATTEVAKIKQENF
jgi:antitoxin component of RelBE/YafQ-DinJ toxin-antitoxin module